MSKAESSTRAAGEESLIYVRRIHRRDLNRVWEFLKKVFRDVNRETVEYQRPRSKKRFLEVYEEEGVEQLLFEVRAAHGQEIVGYAECAFEITGTDNWMNERYFTKHDMRPLFVEELAVHPEYQGRGVGAFMLEQLEHLARIHGCTHLVLEVAENNDGALKFYRKRSFYRLDAAIFMAKKVAVDAELLPPRALKKPRNPEALGAPAKPKRAPRRPLKARAGEKRSSAPPPASRPLPASRPEGPPTDESIDPLDEAEDDGGGDPR
ncbi:GNAT family N-acetyltransferase [Sorangium sp. So ce448]|uniref:GNAT family N-acetyltransferase n=1 Tax=Sorangium sp. So ce448 TaxID=3133314 RepID=UPI003F63C6BE